VRHIVQRYPCYRCCTDTGTTTAGSAATVVRAEFNKHIHESYYAEASISRHAVALLLQQTQMKRGRQSTQHKGSTGSTNDYQHKYQDTQVVVIIHFSST
jgi:hypothetical protein